jgi:DoxX-like family
MGSTKQRWVGRLVTAVPVLFLIFDFSIKLAHIKPVTDTFARLGIPDHLAVPIGILELVCLAIYVIPRTAVLGAVLLTGYLGGAIMMHVRIGDPLFSHILFPVYIGALLWVGLYLRDPRLRALHS